MSGLRLDAHSIAAILTDAKTQHRVPVTVADHPYGDVGDEWLLEGGPVEVTGIHQQRVQDITESEATAEGFRGPMTAADPGGINQVGRSPRTCFRLLWERRHPGSWDRNDMVWVYEIRRAEVPMPEVEQGEVAGKVEP